MCVTRQFVLDLFFFKFSSHLFPWISLIAQLVKNPPANAGDWVRSLGWEDPGRREQLPTPVFLPAEFCGQESDGIQSMGSQRLGHNWVTNTFTFFYHSNNSGKAPLLAVFIFLRTPCFVHSHFNNNFFYFCMYSHGFSHHWGLQVETLTHVSLPGCPTDIP